MAKLIYWMHTTLDGYVEDAHGHFGWSAPDTEVNTYINERSASIGTFLYGRKMYDAMVYWETEYTRHNPEQFHLDWAKQWQAADKIVYSKTLAEPRSARTRIEREIDAEAIRRLKIDAKSDLTITGPELAAHALRVGLVDEIQMFINPIVVGGGKPFFPPGVPLTLNLIEARSFRNGILTVRYAVRN